MSVKATAAEAAANWGTGFSAAGTKYTAGINAVQVAPGQLAAAQQNAYLSGRAGQRRHLGLQGRRRHARLVEAGRHDHRRPRLASGATKGQPKYQAFATQFIPQLSQIVGSLPARGTYDQNIARFTSYAQALHALKGTF